jgi:hypothetical protein
MAEIIEGGCLCGNVKLRVTAEPLAVRTCWCRLCQYLGAGSATVNVCFPAEAVGVEGEVRWYAGKADSGSDMRRGFCPECGTPLFSVAEQRPHLTFIRAGALDDRSIAAPEATIWVKEAPEWACIDTDIPAHQAQLPPVA